jgi:hypothetical protein
MLMKVVTHWVFWVFVLCLALHFYSDTSAFINGEIKNNLGNETQYSLPTSVDVAVYEGFWFLIMRASRTFQCVVLCLVCYGIYVMMPKIEEFFNRLSGIVTAVDGFVKAVMAVFGRRDRMHVDQPEVADGDQEVAVTDAAEDEEIPTRHARSATPLAARGSLKARSSSRGRGRVATRTSSRGRASGSGL